MKISTLGNIVILFINEDDEIVHKIIYEELPNISSLIHNFEEMKDDDEFGIGESYLKLVVAIISMKEYVSLYGDTEI